jgi:hypothetical protein
MIKQHGSKKSNEDFSKHRGRILSNSNVNNTRYKQRKKQQHRPTRKTEFREENREEYYESQIAHIGLERFFKKNVRRNEDGNENGYYGKPSKHLLGLFRLLIWVVRICL